jgi:uncharacterized protein
MSPSAPARTSLRWMAALLAPIGLASPLHAKDALSCHIGTYRLSDHSVLDIAPSEGNTLRWRRIDGETGSLHPMPNGQWNSTYGWTGRSDGRRVRFGGCGSGRIDFDGLAGERIPLKVTETSFVSAGVTLKGRLVLPPGDAAVPVVVLVHGSEDDSALTYQFLQRLFPAQGVGAFVYDKRGTGQSQGHYTQDFNVLADDVVAAMREGRRLAGTRLTRIGYWGGSEGGWVAPLASLRAPVDFVVVSFGLAVGVVDEDQEAMEIELREKGFSRQDIRDAQELARAAEKVFESDMQAGYPELAAEEAKYRDRPWYKDARGDFAFMILTHTEAELRGMAATYDWHTPFDYDPMQTLRASSAPQLWIVGGEDYESPSAVTSERIKSLIAQGHPFTLAYYPGAEHGMTLFETGKDGERLSTRYEPGYFTMMTDYIKDGRLKDHYGDAELTLPNR